MNDIKKLIVLNNASLIEVLKKINDLPLIQTVFVVDEHGRVQGTITDGDIRRGLIKGLKIDDSLEHYIFKDFSFLTEGENNFEKLKMIRQKRLKVVPLLDKEGRLLKVFDFTTIKSILPIDAVIMSGGEGRRLRPLTENTPKPLLHVGTKPIIQYNIERLYQFGIDHQTITTKYLAEQIEQFCMSLNSNIHFRFYRENEFLGTIGSVPLVGEFKNDYILITNSDLLTNINYEDFFISFLEKKSDMAVASIPYQVNVPYAVLEENNRKVLSLKEKPTYTHFANAGIYLIKKELLSLIPRNKFFNATDLLEEVIKNGYTLTHYPIRSYWLDIGNLADFEKAQRDISHINFD